MKAPMFLVLFLFVFLCGSSVFAEESTADDLAKSVQAQVAEIHDYSEKIAGATTDRDELYSQAQPLYLKAQALLEKVKASDLSGTEYQDLAEQCLSALAGLHEVYPGSTPSVGLIE